MSNGITANDLWPLILKMPADEQLRLAKLALRAASAKDRDVYRVSPPAPDEFSSDDDALAWEGGGWDDFAETR